MRRLQPLDFSRNLRLSSSSDENEEEDDRHRKKSHQHENKSTYNSPTTTTRPMPSIANFSTDTMHTRLSLLPAYPSFEQSSTTNLQDHLLLVNVSRQLLTSEQQRRYQERDKFLFAFQHIDQNHQNYASSYFLQQYRELFMELSRRLHLNDAILDYNYQRLLHCFDLMTQERLSRNFQQHALTSGDILPLHEYPLALEFFLQIDQDVFFMKTCSFRGATMEISSRYEGIFAREQPSPCYGMTTCTKPFCHFCFPPLNVPNRTRLYQPVVQFSPAQEHRFVSGYRSILNCPATCQTKNILYVLTCPCGQYDYIGYTSMSLGQRLLYHRENGNRIIHEFIFGLKNIARVDDCPKPTETLTKDDMLLYKHSARCPAAIQLFLDCNPQYWPFVPMLQHEAQQENLNYRLPDSIPVDPSSLVIPNNNTRSDHEAGSCMTDLPPLPSNQYTFSNRQSAEQFQYFKEKRDYFWPNFNLDLYNAAIIAVLPDYCSMPFCRLLEALFITHTQTKLNTLGHLDNIVISENNTNQNGSTKDSVTDRGEWCRNLLRRPLSSGKT